jgi:hypothetical protein
MAAHFPGLLQALCEGFKPDYGAFHFSIANILF